MKGHFGYKATSAVRVRNALVCSLVMLVLTIVPAGADTEYRLSIGDTVHIDVFGMKELDRRATVGGDGKIWVPSIGHIRAAGLTLRELREHLSSVLTMNESIRASDINVDVVEFRPFYIDGAVAKPGAYPYRVGLTVRQAIALAGGFLRALPTRNDSSAPLEVRGSYQILWRKYVQLDARVARLRAELEGKDRFDWTPSPKFPVSPEIARRIAGLEERQFKARLKNVEQKKTQLDDAIRLTEGEIAHLEEKLEREKVESKLVSKTASQMEGFLKRGVVPLLRLSEYERAAAIFRQYLDSTTLELIRARRNRQELLGKREQIDLARREELTSELQSKTIEMETLHSQIVAAANTLLNLNAPIKGDCPPEMEKRITIDRRKDGQNERLPAEYDSEVLPGDVIEVKMPNEALMMKCITQRLGMARIEAGQ